MGCKVTHDGVADAVDGGDGTDGDDDAVLTSQST